MQPSGQYLLVRNFAFLREGWRSYAGFDGDVLFEDTRRESLLRRAESEAGAENSTEVRCVFISSTDRLEKPGPEFPFIGFDAGWYSTKYDHYSLVLNYAAGRGWLPRLNRHLLLDSRGDAEALLAEWEAWHPIDGDKEAMGEACVLQVFGVFAQRKLQ